MPEYSGTFSFTTKRPLRVKSFATVRAEVNDVLHQVVDDILYQPGDLDSQDGTRLAKNVKVTIKLDA